jgi:hypothetical protein
MRTTGMAAGSRPWVRITGGLLCVLVLAACGPSTGGGSASAVASGGPTTSARVTPTAKVTATAPITLVGLKAKLKAGSASVTSAHLTMSGTIRGQSYLSVQGDETLTAGKLTALRLNQKVAGLNLTMVIVDDTLYVKLPVNARKNGKPWVKATEESADPAMRQLAASVKTLRESASMSQYESLTESASLFRTVGVERLNGVAVTHYSLMVDVTKERGAAISDAMRKSLKTLGISKIPVDIWVDGQGRTVRMAERFKVKGETVSIEVTMTRINRQVTIVAPPASQVSTDSRVKTV